MLKTTGLLIQIHGPDCEGVVEEMEPQKAGGLEQMPFRETDGACFTSA